MFVIPSEVKDLGSCLRDRCCLCRQHQVPLRLRSGQALASLGM